MSRIGKQPVTMPVGVTATCAHATLTVTGPKGSLQQTLHPHVSANVEGQVITITVAEPNLKSDRALWGLTRALAANMVRGVHEGFTRQLEVNGVGYRASVAGHALNLKVGFSHDVVFDLPQGIEAKVEKNVITLTGTDKQVIGDVAARIRRVRPPEPYKGKGIKYVEETVRRKAGKVAKSAE